MLISHRYRFIFIKTGKTAGTSIEVDFSQRLASDDIVTPIFPKHPDHHPRNYKAGWRRRYRNHMSALEVKTLLGEPRFSEYYKFCVEREPVSKCVSHFHMIRNSPVHRLRHFRHRITTWEHYLDHGHFPIDHPKYLDEAGNLLVDRILRYEHLEEDLAALCAHLQFPFSGLTTRAKSGFKQELTVSAWDRERIYEAFRESLPFTGYSL